MGESYDPHRLNITYSSRIDEGVIKDRKWWVECSCGYYSGPFKSEREADDDHVEHILAVSD